MKQAGGRRFEPAGILGPKTFDWRLAAEEVKDVKEVVNAFKHQSEAVSKSPHRSIEGDETLQFHHD